MMFSQVYGNVARGLLYVCSLKWTNGIFVDYIEIIIFHSGILLLEVSFFFFNFVMLVKKYLKATDSCTVLLARID